MSVLPFARNNKGSTISILVVFTEVVVPDTVTLPVTFKFAIVVTSPVAPSITMADFVTPPSLILKLMSPSAVVF